MQIEELWIYPIKACRGVRVKSANVTASGFEHDRAWCIVDLDGEVVARCEAISQRKLPILATINVTFNGDSSALLVNAPGMRQLEVPTAPSAYASEPMVQVQASGVSTTTDGGWWLGAAECRQNTAGSAWLTEYLNRDAGDPERPGVRVSGKKSESHFAICRCLGHGIDMSSYPPIFPLTENAATDPRFAGNARRFADFAPFLLVNQASADFVASRVRATGVECESYPIGSFRGNIVVRSAKPWAEETWRRITVRRGASTDSVGTPVLTLHKIKECPRCTVPCRDGHSGGFVFPTEKLMLWKVLKAAFPAKFSDPQWGTWAGAFFGVYFGHAGVVGGTIRVGDAIVVDEKTRWDAHLRGGLLRSWSAAVAVLILAALAAFASLQWS